MPEALNLASTRSSPDRSTKSTRLCLCSTSTACRHRVSGSFSLPSRGPFHLSFTVLYAIGHWVVFSLTGWSPLVPTGFPVSRGTLDPARPAPASGTGLSPSVAGCSKAVPLPLPDPLCSPNPAMHASRFGLFRVRSPLLTESMVSFSSSGYLDVSVPRVPFHKLWIHLWMTVVFTAGFPHSEIPGSKDICSSPGLIAAYHVFHRLPVPRHPPCALLCLTFVSPSPIYGKMAASCPS